MDKKQEDFDKLFDDLFKKDDKNKDGDKKEEKPASDDLFDDDFLESLFKDDDKDKKEDITPLPAPPASDTKDKKNEEENFDWLKELIDEIDREEQEKKQQTASSGQVPSPPAAIPAKPVKPSFTSKLKDKPRPPKPPEHIQAWGSGKKTVIMPVRDENGNAFRRQSNVNKLHVAYTVLICCSIFLTSLWGYSKFLHTHDDLCTQDSIVMKQVYSGDKILIDAKEVSESGRDIVKKGYIDAHISNLMYKLVKPGDKVIDAGAGFGYYTLYLARIVGYEGKVYSFEARKHVFELLDSSIRINKLPNVETFNKVLFSESVGMVIETHDHQKRSNFGVANILLDQENIYSNTEHREAVNAVTLDDALPNMRNVSLLNINAHGHELSILLGAQNIISASPKIKIITTWSKYRMIKYVNIQSTVSQMLSNGFRFWLIKPSNGNLVELTQLEHIMQVERGRFLIAKTLN